MQYTFIVYYSDIVVIYMCIKVPTVQVHAGMCIYCLHMGDLADVHSCHDDEEQQAFCNTHIASAQNYTHIFPRAQLANPHSSIFNMPLNQKHYRSFVHERLNGVPSIVPQ